MKRRNMNAYFRLKMRVHLGKKQRGEQTRAVSRDFRFGLPLCLGEISVICGEVLPDMSPRRH